MTSKLAGRLAVVLKDLGCAGLVDGCKRQVLWLSYVTSKHRKGRNSERPDDP